MASFCDYYDQDICRSCAWIEVGAAEQLRRKEETVRESLALFAPFPLEATVPSAPKGFRNRAKMVVTGTAIAPVIGLEGKLDLDKGRELLSCPIHHPRLNEVIGALPEWIKRMGLEPYRIRERKGELKGLIAFYSPHSEEMYLRWILRSHEAVPVLRSLISPLQQQFPFLTCVSANIQPIPHAILEGPEEICLTEQDSITHRLGDFSFELSPQAFVQTNVEVATQLYQTAAEWIGESRAMRGLELFCGTGAFTFFAAHHTQSFHGIEVNPQAVGVANKTARRLGLSHVSFECADAGCAETKIADYKPDLILANPPRRGLAASANWILQHGPEHFLYSSCAIESLARDLEPFAVHYRIRRVQIFDLFPHTSHFETLVWLTRKTDSGNFPRVGFGD